MEEKEKEEEEVEGGGALMRCGSIRPLLTPCCSKVTMIWPWLLEENDLWKWEEVDICHIWKPDWSISMLLFPMLPPAYQTLSPVYLYMILESYIFVLYSSYQSICMCIMFTTCRGHSAILILIKTRHLLFTKDAPMQTACIGHVTS